MIHPFWKSKTGKLVISGCGTQVGMLFALGALTATLLFGAVCVSFNVLSIGLTQQFAVAAGSSANVPLKVTPSSEEEVNLLLEEINSLLVEIELLQANTPVVPVPVKAPAPPSLKPVVTASQTGAELHSGPGTNYDKVGVLSPGEALEIVGRNSEATWWLVAMPNGLFAWVPDVAVVASNVNQTIPVVTLPSLLAQPASSGSAIDPPTAMPTPTPTATATPTPALPPGTPTAAADEERRYVEEMASYKKVKPHLRVPPVSASISPDGRQIAMTERIKLYTVTTDGAHTDIWFEDNDDAGPIGGVVWSPDGKYIAFLVGFKQKYCKPCRAVAILNVADKTITYLEPPGDMDTDMPRWTQDGRLLVNAHPGEPADGVAYVYNIYGESQVASGTYFLSASHEGQKWYPWKPGRIWRAGVSERADSYNSD